MKVFVTTLLEIQRGTTVLHMAADALLQELREAAKAELPLTAAVVTATSLCFCGHLWSSIIGFTKLPDTKISRIGL